MAPRPPTDLVSIALLSVALSYLVKYGETLLPATRDAGAAVPGAALMVLAFSGLNAWKWSARAKTKGDFEGFI